MNNLWAKIANGIDLATSKDIPDAGELWIDPKTNNAKIGDGKTPLFELPWITLSVDLSVEPPREYKMPDHVKRFIEANIDTIERCDYDRLYNYIVTDQMKRDVTRALLEAGINPRPYLTIVPRCIQDLLLDKVDNLDNKIYNHNYDDWALDYVRAYTKSEIDRKLHEITEEFTKKVYKDMGIPSHLMTIKVGEGN